MTSIRSFLAGTGASGALLVAAFIASVAVTALLAFDGLPGGNGDSDAQVVALDQPDSSSASAARAAGAAVGSASGAVAASPAPARGTGDGVLLAAAGSGVRNVAGSGDDPGGDSTNPPSRDRDGTPNPAPRCEDGSAPPCDPLDDLIDDGEGATDGILGIRPGIGEATRPIRESVNGVLEDTTGNTLGGHIRDVLGRDWPLSRRR